jgi:hypothetical protein
VCLVLGNGSQLSPKIPTSSFKKDNFEGLGAETGSQMIRPTATKDLFALLRKERLQLST